NVGTGQSLTVDIGNRQFQITSTSVSVEVSPMSVAEDGSTNLVYTFTRSGETSGALTVSFDVAGTAAFSTDYTQSGAATFSGTSGTVDFGAGWSTATVTIDPTADATVEPDETVMLTVLTAAGYVAASPDTASGTIHNDDGGPDLLGDMDLDGDVDFDDIDDFVLALSDAAAYQNIFGVPPRFHGDADQDGDLDFDDIDDFVGILNAPVTASAAVSTEMPIAYAQTEPRLRAAGDSAAFQIAVADALAAGDQLRMSLRAPGSVENLPQGDPNAFDALFARMDAESVAEEGTRPELRVTFAAPNASVKAMAVIGEAESDGQPHFSTDRWSNWTPFGSRATISARLLDLADQMRFVQNPVSDSFFTDFAVPRESGGGALMAPVAARAIGVSVPTRTTLPIANDSPYWAKDAYFSQLELASREAVRPEFWMRNDLKPS
ncbi:MAG: hypothetical protein ACC645_20790, partial [Pirellulales bacterium]